MGETGPKGGGPKQKEGVEIGGGGAGAGVRVDKAEGNGFEKRNMSSTHLYFFWYLVKDNFSYMSDPYFAKSGHFFLVKKFLKCYE